jgi:hypothetical protein
MRTRLACLGLVFLVVAQIFVATDSSAARRRRGWELLGQRSVTDGVDHDTIAAAGQGTFRSLKIRVKGHAVQFRDMKIHFSNGDVQDVELRHAIPAGGESRVIDVEGRDRSIRSVEFWYDAQTILGKKAEVELYGLN